MLVSIPFLIILTRLVVREEDEDAESSALEVC